LHYTISVKRAVLPNYSKKWSKNSAVDFQKDVFYWQKTLCECCGVFNVKFRENSTLHNKYHDPLPYLLCTFWNVSWLCLKIYMFLNLIDNTMLKRVKGKIEMLSAHVSNLNRQTIEQQLWTTCVFLTNKDNINKVKGYVYFTPMTRWFL
jgi:hypothetical protein